MWETGLSPRVRGNRQARGGIRGHHGSIPACAGEPSRCGPCRAVVEVYPRVCGGTTNIHPVTLSRHGLSPRVRGNRLETKHMSPNVRSIPACAGEPPLLQLTLRSVQVYPRVCGGTHFYTAEKHTILGLSPRVRGNQR